MLLCEPLPVCHGDTEDDDDDAPSAAAAPAAPAAGAKPNGAEADGALERPLILVVDDDDAVCEMLGLILGDEGYDVMSACDGQAALSLLDSGRIPDLIILDLMMPKVSGWEVWDRVQTTPALVDTPVLIYTASGLGPGSVGSATVLAKTTDLDVLLETIRRHIGARAKDET